MQKMKVLDSIVVLTAGTEKGFEADQFSKTANITMKRLVASAAIYNETKKPIIILGGVTKKNEPAESVTSSKVLMAMGVPPQKIITEEKSTNTHESIQELEKIMSAHGFNNAVVVSSASHLPRIQMLLIEKKIKAILVPTACIAPSGIDYEDLVPSIKNMEINLTLLYEILGNIKYAIFY